MFAEQKRRACLPVRACRHVHAHVRPYGLRLTTHASAPHKGVEIGDFGGSLLEPPRQCLGSQWLDLTLGVPRCAEPPGAA